VAGAERLAKAAKDNGFAPRAGQQDDPAKRIVGYISSLPFQDQFTSLLDIVTGLGTGWTLRYAKDDHLGPGGCDGCENHRFGLPTLVDHLLNANFVYTFPEPGEWLSASLIIEPGDLIAPTWFLIDQLAVFPAPAPNGTHLVSGMFDFRNLGIEPLLAHPLDYRLSFNGDPARTLPYLFDGSGWLPIADFHVEGDELIFASNRVVPIAAFETVPEAPVLMLWLTALALLAWSRSRRQQRRAW
jgi:hypothetical protein